MYVLVQKWPTFFPKPPILFKSNSYPPHKRKTSKFHSKTKLFSKKKKVIAGNQGAIGHRLATPDTARYKLWNFFHLKYFPQLQCATTNRPMHCRLATPGIYPSDHGTTTEALNL